MAHKNAVAATSEGPITQKSQDDGGDADVNHVRATPEKPCNDLLEVMETNDGSEMASGRTHKTNDLAPQETGETTWGQRVQWSAGVR